MSDRIPTSESPQSTLYSRLPHHGDPHTPDGQVEGRMYDFPRPELPHKFVDHSRRVSQHSLPPMSGYDQDPSSLPAPPAVYGSYPPSSDTRVPLTNEGWARRIAARRHSFFSRLSGRGLKSSGIVIPGVWESLVRVFYSSWMNVLFVFVPLSWTAHFLHWDARLVFGLSVFALVPLERMADFLGEELALYCGHTIGDFIAISLHNTVEAALALILLHKCELRLVQSTVVGVVLLHLLLVPGAAFLTGGAKIFEQHLLEVPSQLNQPLMTVGVLTCMIPAAIFAVLNETPMTEAFRQASQTVATTATEVVKRAAKESNVQLTTDPFTPVTDDVRGAFLNLSRGLAIILFIVYVASRVYLHNPPSSDHVERAPTSRGSLLHAEMEAKELEHGPKINPWVCVVLLIILIGLMVGTAEWLVYSVLKLAKMQITEEWLGLILLPLASFLGDALVAIVYFVKSIFRLHPEAPPELAKGRDIDSSIQFMLFWLPILVLVSWGMNKPLSMLFDLYEVIVLIGSCFLVNYVTQDSKTNWVEGFMMCSFYAMIALSAWFYHGQVSHSHMITCTKTVAESVLAGADQHFGMGH
ncbi:hypothetical protein FRC02_012331 [Tulasnella sp. 418]|nr:hypothetical protein FRC02_012331 [Tulasnella sp. 418]